VVNPEERSTYRLSDIELPSNDRRLRCTAEGKVILSKRHAEIRAKEVRGGIEAYRCPVNQQFWHLGHLDKNAKLNRRKYGKANG
jgi:hypothetical protein